MNVLDFSTSNSQVADEIINVSDANPITLKHDTFYNKVGKAIVITTGPGGTGTTLVNPLDGASDYTPGGAYTFPEPYNTTLAGDVGYTTIAITNAAYHSTDLYVSYYPIWDLLYASRWNNNNIIPHYKSSPYDISATTVEIDLTELNSFPNGTTRRVSAYDGDGSDYLWFTDNSETINGIPIADIKIEGTGGLILTKISDGVFKAVGELGGEIWDSDGGNFTGVFSKCLSGLMICGQVFDASLNANVGANNIFGTGAGTIYYANNAVTFPLAFVAEPEISISSDGVSTHANTATAAGFNLRPYYNASATTLSGSYTAVGRWTTSYPRIS